jgi:hypothetical protein
MMIASSSRASGVSFNPSPSPPWPRVTSSQSSNVNTLFKVGV